jgi:IS5 family transposase
MRLLAAGRPPFPVETMLRIHFMQQWFGLSDPAMEEALFDVPLYREFAGLDNGNVGCPTRARSCGSGICSKPTSSPDPMLATVNDVLRDKGLMLRIGTVVDATLISAPSSTKNDSGNVTRRCIRPRRAISGTSA